MNITLGYFHTDKSRIVLNNDGAVITTMFSTQYRDMNTYFYLLKQVDFMVAWFAHP